MYQTVFKDKELELDFVIVSADPNKFVYFVPEDPERNYVLKRVEESPYLFEHERRLKPLGQGTDGLEDGKHFRVRGPDFIDRVEEDYRSLLRGGDPCKGLELD